MTTNDLLRQLEELKTENSNLLFANRYSMNVEAETLVDLKLMTVERDALKRTCERAFHAINGLLAQRPIRDLDETMCELANAIKGLE